MMRLAMSCVAGSVLSRRRPELSEVGTVENYYFREAFSGRVSKSPAWTLAGRRSPCPFINFQSRTLPAKG